MFPTPEYIQECIKNADRLREEWEKRGPKYLDMMAVLDSGVLEKVAPLLIPKIIDTWDVVWLPRLGQLLEMIEERGVLSWAVGRVGPDHPDCDPMEEAEEGVKYYASPMPISKETISEGPDPETALLRAYLEVAKDE